MVITGKSDMSIRTVAIVGCGIGRSHIVEGYLPHSDKFKVVAICDLNEQRMAAVGDEFGIERRATSLRNCWPTTRSISSISARLPASIWNRWLQHLPPVNMSSAKSR